MNKMFIKKAENYYSGFRKQKQHNPRNAKLHESGIIVFQGHRRTKNNNNEYIFYSKELSLTCKSVQSKVIACTHPGCSVGVGWRSVQ